RPARLERRRLRWVSRRFGPPCPHVGFRRRQALACLAEKCFSLARQEADAGPTTACCIRRTVSISTSGSLTGAEHIVPKHAYAARDGSAGRDNASSTSPSRAGSST